MKWLKLKLFALFLLSLCVRVPLAADSLDSQYLNIREQLTGLKNQSEFVTEQLMSVSENLQLSQAEAKEWETTSIALSDSLMSITEQYNDCYEQLVAQKTLNKRLTKSLVGIASIMAALLVAWAVAIYINIKKRAIFI